MPLRICTIYQVLMCLLLVGCHAKQGQFHLVKKGQTTTQIAHVHDISVEDIQKANPQRNLNRIYAGQRLWIPSIKKVSQQSEAKVKRVLDAHNVRPTASKIPSKPSVTTQKLHFQWPYKGRILVAFGKENLKMHNGIDIELPSEHAIVASQKGKVAYIGSEIEGYGKTVILQHDDYLFTIYAYLGAINVSKGQMIAQGQAVGHAQKQTGQSFFHFEIRKVKTALDPLQFLK
ncbi:MAG: peptidoglycan DD-metalloendopeptidase family protein [Bdellovibrionales bacterium]|nr:peptidoglycan DD-metalloendopeptidase family protein [Bdellovibrionales bacterium]